MYVIRVQLCSWLNNYIFIILYLGHDTNFIPLRPLPSSALIDCDERERCQ
jgi:hypothetical protein